MVKSSLVVQTGSFHPGSTTEVALRPTNAEKNIFPVHVCSGKHHPVLAKSIC